MRKVIILTVIIVAASTAIALASWQVASWISGGGKEPPSGRAVSAEVAEGGFFAPVAAAVEALQGTEVGAAGDEARRADASPSGESFSVENPDQVYLTETQRQQNFLRALAEGNIKRLDVTATDFQPAGDANSSFVYVIIATSDGARTDGSIVMKYSGGAGGTWRIGTVRLSGSLAGGTNYPVPDSFEADLAREVAENQDFLRKTAEGRLAYMTINNVNRTGDAEVVLTGVVGGKGGGTYPAEMILHKDYELWHLTNIRAL